MTVSLRNAPVGRAACNGRVTRQESAPALFRLLSDSALSRAALASCAAAVAIVDAQDARWPIAHLNPAFERLFGYRESEARGKPFAPLILDHELALEDRLIDAHTPQEMGAYHRDGTRLDVDVALGPVHDSAGNLTHWVVTLSDRTELARLRAELARLQKPLRAA
jgi:PAS domain S-box-containing protein